MSTDDRRLIEDYLPIQAISAEASREKSVRKGHISTLHLWWARRPLVACRAAVYGALVPISRFRPANGPEEKRDSLARANAARFVERLCKYPGDPTVIKQAERHILEAHAERLTKETGKKVTVEDIEEGRAPRPKVLDMFAGGGSIPLEALRLGCEAYALDLNPVAHIIELCTLVYPQKYGKPDPTARGMTGPPGPDGKPTWGGLAEEVRYWGNWVLEKVKAEIGDLYPPLPDLEWWHQVGQAASLATQTPMFPSVKKGVAKTRRKLPHWEKVGGCYFVTYRTKDGFTLPDKARDVVLENWKYWSGERYDLWQVVVMPDHVHLLLSPLQKHDGSYWTLSEILHTAKSYSANQINKILGRSGSLWQDERFDHLIRNPASFEEKWHYIRQNPCKAGLVLRPDDYPWLYEDDGLAARPTLTPVAYLWTRTVQCKNPSCRATVPLVKQTWLCKKKGRKKRPGRYVALKIIAPKGEKKVRFEVVEAMTEKGLGFDPSVGSKGGNATCPFCGTVADADYVQALGKYAAVGTQLMAVVCTNPQGRGKQYIPDPSIIDQFIPSDADVQRRICVLSSTTGFTLPTERINPLRPSPNARGLSAVTRHGFASFGDLFTPRQLLAHMTYGCAVREVFDRIGTSEMGKAIAATLALVVSRTTDWNSANCRWFSQGENNLNTFGRQPLPMLWDFCETNAVIRKAESFETLLEALIDALPGIGDMPKAAECERGTTTQLSEPRASYDAVVTDPPYYDNVPYADISDFFYVWLKRILGPVFPEHFASELTPKKMEATALANRHGGDMARATTEYESMMIESLREAQRVLKAGAPLVVVYAHKTTLGWSTLVDAIRKAGFTVTEAWPMDTEVGSRLVATNASALASSIFLVARKREGHKTGSYEDEVQSELDHIVRERVDSLWQMGITGADLVIAAVGAGLRAFTRFARVEYANGEEVPAEKFLAEVEGVVLETLLEKIFKVAGAGVAAVDGPSRFYVLWRYTYKTAEMDAGEAIVFTYGQNVELDGPNGLSAGTRALVEKKKGKYRLLDFTERGDNEKLGLSVGPAASRSASGAGSQPAPLIDVLHRILWLMEYEPRSLNRFLDEAQPDRERLRLLAQALAGAALEGSRDNGGEHAVATTPAEQAALKKLLANWRALIERRLAAGPLFAGA